MSDSGTLYCQECSSTRIVKNARRRSNGKQRHKCMNCGYRGAASTEMPEVPFQLPTDVPVSDRYVVTCAQNATPVHEGFLAALEAYCKRNKAVLIVLPLRYRNPTSIFADESHEWWSPEIEQYLCAGRGQLNRNLTLLGDVPIQPTAVVPLTGLEGLTKSQSGIVGHPKLALETIATPNKMLPKIMTTTGAVTVPNYTSSKAGKKGEFHHTFGAAVVEIEDADSFHLRQINALDDGSFIDLDREYLPTGRTRRAPQAEAITIGDSHVQWFDEDVDHATFWADDGIINVLRPKILLWHDVLDQYAKGHHDARDPFIQYGKQQARLNNVQNEVEDAIAYVKARTRKYQTSVLVPSNHVEHLNRWVKDSDWREDPDNALFYLKTATAMLERTIYDHEHGGVRTPSAFNYWFKFLEPEFFERYVETPRDSYMVSGIECGLHGDVGPNGARGSRVGLSKIGVKTNIGHSHSPGIRDGCYQAGTSSMLRLQYTRGPSSWLNTHIIIYANGKRSLISVINGKWRA